MALETLKGVLKIDGFAVNHSGRKKKDKFVTIDHEKNEITFRIQNGPIKENGVNGCQVDTIVETAQAIVTGLNVQFPCKENKKIIHHLASALHWSKKRKADREKRNVEGKNEV
jgi:hypothetical protein